MVNAKIVIQKFFLKLFPDDDSKGLIEVREIRSKNKYPKQRFFNTVNEIIDYDPPGNRNIYFGIYKRGYKRKSNNLFDGSISNCLYTNAIYLDFDNLKLDQVKNNIKKRKIPYPTAIINSGYGYHCYWVLTEKIFDITILLKIMQKVTGADAKAVDKARVFRLPGSYNVKYAKKKMCEIIELNENQYQVQMFLDLFNVKIDVKKKKKFKNTIDLSTIEINRHCIKEMLKGVNDGYRHFSLGRITKHFQQIGYNQENVRQTVLSWNQKNNPPLRESEIINCFYKCWNENYKLLGCRIVNIEKQAKLSLFCDKTKCDLHFVGSQLEFAKSFGLNNRIFNNYRSVTGYYIIVYSILERHPEGLTTSQIGEKLINNTSKTSCMGKNSKSESLRYLMQQGFVEVVLGNKKAGIENFYRFKKQGTYNLGYTIINNGAVNGAIDGRITKQQLKVYALLCKYAFANVAFPSLLTISKETGLRTNYISMLITNLEKADYLKKQYSLNKKGTSKLLCRLMV